MNVKFIELTTPTAEIAEYFTQWENDPRLLPFIRPNKDKEALESREKVTITAWIGILIGEEKARDKGIGRRAMEYLEEQIKLQRLKRIELGVFEFNGPAIRLYEKLGYKEFARLEGFTYWQGKMWQDIRMEKYL